MEPLSALSIATSVVQFVDFTIKVILHGREIKNDGASVNVDTLTQRTEELKSWVAGLNIPIERRDATLQMKYNHTTWKSFHIALKTVINRDKSEELTESLEDYRNELSLHLLALMNAKHDLYSSRLDNRLDHINKTQSRIVEILTFTQSRSDTLKDVAGEVGKGRAPVKQEEVLSAIIGLKDGTTLAFSDKDCPRTTGQSTPKQNIERVITFRESLNSSDDMVFNHHFSILSKLVLKSLYFRMMRMRVDTTAEAHSGTFSWVFQIPKEGKWSNFARWLRQGTGIYWITGKPGSGKSTLMKYILQAPRTEELLNGWKGHDTLVKAEFFFWASGTTIQTSLEGLLRALLHSLLEQCPNTIPSAFPSVCKEIMAGSEWGELGLLPRSTEPTLAELDMAIRLLVEKSKGIKFCLFIDGLDEYSGAQDKIIQTFQKLASHPHVKILIASRPWVIFQDAFYNKPRLRVQDLTYPDIEKYVSDSLSASHGLQEMQQMDARLYNTLVSAVCQKSQGVFLWMILAVRSLLDGLMNGDRVSMLNERIEQLPSDLQEMYTEMFDGITPR